MRVVAAAENELRSHLDSGEKLLWVGRPAQGIVLTWQDGYLIPFGMVWLGSAVHGFWPCLPVDGIGCTLKREPLVLFVAAGLLFIGSGIYLLIGRFLADFWYRSRLIYGVTDRRAIILSGMCRRSVQSIYFSSLITLKPKSAGIAARFTSGKIIHLIGTTHTTAQSSALTHPAGRPVWVKSSSFGLQMQKRSSRF